MIDIALARLPSRYTDTHDIEALIKQDFEAGAIDLDDIRGWAHQALMRDLLDRLPTTPPADDTTYPAETRLEHIRWMLETAWATDMSVDKAARWLAFVQGVSAVRGWIDVSQERDRTRHILHMAARVGGKDTPQTIGRDTT